MQPAYFIHIHFKTEKSRTSGQEGGVGRHTVPPAQPKGGQQQFKNKKQPELTENRTVWKSDNQGDKEETFIQTSRRGGDGQLGWRGLATRWWIVEQGGQSCSWLARQ